MMSEETKRQGHVVALSGVIGFVLVALLVGMAFGGYLSMFVVAPYIQNNQQGNGYQNDNGYQGSNNENTGTINNNNPSPANPTSSYGGSGQFNLAINQNGNQISGTMSTNIDCDVEQNGNSIQMALTLTITQVSSSLQQAVNSDKSETFNFAGTISGPQISANAQGTIGSGDSTAAFEFRLSGSIEENSLTLTVSSTSNSQISLNTSEPIVLHPN
jgi:hypothetical protein